MLKDLIAYPSATTQMIEDVDIDIEALDLLMMRLWHLLRQKQRAFAW